jgi:lipoprotein-anchoring transpeptidase ErfK/SrfK
MVLLAAVLLVSVLAACEKWDAGPAGENRGSGGIQPTIEASPIAGDSGQWRIVSGDYVNLTVKAPEAQRVSIFYRPVAASDQYIELKNLGAPSKPSGGEFTANIRLPADFAGDVWAQADYSDGGKRDSEAISLANVAVTNPNEAPASSAGSVPEHSSVKPAADPTDKSALSDEITAGKTEQASFQAAQPGIKITVNVPAFQLCLWQNGKLVKTYEIGVGRKDFPIDISNRKIRQVIFNPEWVPPDSSWVNRDPKVTPGEHIMAGDSRNPLGKIKIPLGNGYLIHQAEKSADIGHLVSHGCIRMQQDDLIDLAQKIISAESVQVPQDQIEHALASSDRLVVSLKSPVPISIRYDAFVVQQGVLHVYPDIYNRVANPVETLKTDLFAAQVNTAGINDRVLSQMIDRANRNYEYVVETADLRSGNALVAGRAKPLTTQNAPAEARRRTESGSPKIRHVRRSRR